MRYQRPHSPISDRRVFVHDSGQDCSGYPVVAVWKRGDRAFGPILRLPRVRTERESVPAQGRFERNEALAIVQTTSPVAQRGPIGSSQVAHSRGPRVGLSTLQLVDPIHTIRITSRLAIYVMSQVM